MVVVNSKLLSPSSCDLFPTLIFVIFQLLPTLSGITNKYLCQSSDENFKMDNWTLYSLTVRPQFQGRGIAKQLLKIGEDQVIRYRLSRTEAHVPDKPFIRIRRLLLKASQPALRLTMRRT